MRQFILYLFTISSLIVIFGYEKCISGIVGDIDNDGRVGVREAVYALQIASQLKPELPASTFIVWKAEWKCNEEYKKYDAVEYGGSSYICVENHKSVIPEDLKLGSLWQVLALKGECDSSQCVSPEQVSVMIEEALSEVECEDEIIIESDKLSVSALKNVFTIAMTYFREQGISLPITVNDLYAYGYIDVGGITMTIRSGSYDSLLMTASHINTGKVYSVDKLGTITPNETFSNLVTDQLKIFLGEIRQSANRLALVDLKNAYTSAQAYFAEFPSEVVDIDKLKMAGYKQSRGVTLVIGPDDQETLSITSAHILGSLTYHVDRMGNISPYKFE